ncbi:Sucrase/ferredoxin-like-domain-containing protein [Scheffersomyces xylosifermentans]|uniref:Sucrase/ferredoxin-like-domain-containing protein n=1 Tax=Scheffersomyces xylosifermentans TaxID=1304137 RepID=UPI00315D1F05
MNNLLCSFKYKNGSFPRRGVGTSKHLGKIQMSLAIGRGILVNPVFRRSLGYNARSIVPTCPPPEYDTGCTHCSIPQFPPGKQIDFKTNLNGTSVLPWKHLLVLSHGMDDFDEMPSKIELIPGSLSSEINGLKRDNISPHHPVLVSNILLTSHESVLRQYDVDLAGREQQLVYLYPDRKVIRFDKKHTKDFIKKYLVPEGYKKQEVYNPFKKSSASEHIQVEEYSEVDSDHFTEFPIEKDIVLICGHTKRDVRCGVLAPLLEREFSEVLRKECLNMDTDVGLISHIGGHAYAGNVIYLPRKSEKEIVWYGRVFTDRVYGIVSETIKKGNIISELYRGQLND